MTKKAYTLHRCSDLSTSVYEGILILYRDYKERLFLIIHTSQPSPYVNPKP